MPDPRKCPKCGEPHTRNHRYCAPCLAAYMREWRKTHPLTGAALMKARARAIANVYQGRGHIPKRPCEKCGNPNSQKHHPDYTQPLLVVWLCIPCHHAVDPDEGRMKPINRPRKRRLMPGKVRNLV